MFTKLLAVILSAVSLSNSHLNFTITTVDSDRNVGRYPSVLLDDNSYPVISYYESSYGGNGDLKLARCNDPFCTNKTLTIVDSDGDVGAYTSLALDENSYPAISYYDSTNTALKIARCHNILCTNRTLTTIDSDREVGGFTSLALDHQSYAAISYYDFTNRHLKFARCHDLVCNNATVITIDDEYNTGQYSSISLDGNGRAVISYYDNSVAKLKLARCYDVVCSSRTLTTIDSRGASIGQRSSLSLDRNSYPVISYFELEPIYRSIGLARCHDLVCDNSTLTTVDSSNLGMAGFTSLALDRNGYAVISYSDAYQYDLMLIRCYNKLCTNRTLLTVDSTIDEVEATSITLDGGDNPVISYYAQHPNYNLKLARAVEDPGSPTTSPTLSPSIFPTISPSGHPSISPTISPATYPVPSPTPSPLYYKRYRKGRYGYSNRRRKNHRDRWSRQSSRRRYAKKGRTRYNRRYRWK